MSFSPDSSIVNRTIDLNYANTKRASSLKWIVVNMVLFLLFAYDLSHKCAGYTSALHWVELCLAGVLGANVLQHALRLARARRPPLALTPRQRRLLGLRGADGPAAPPAPAPREAPATASLSPARSWRAADSPPPSPPSPASPASPRLERLAAADRFIADRRALADYLREWGAAQAAGSGAAESAGEAWTRTPPSHHYQLASTDSAEGSALEEGGGATGGAAARAPAVWRRLLLEPQRLTEWNQNLRLWLHVTILERLVREMALVDAALAALGLGDVRLGHVSAERLQKLPAAAALPSLAALLPYLEPFADQRYVVQRIRELTHGGCLSAYRWNGGGSDWDESKPTDAEVVLHLLAAYLDGQLPPAPAARPFSASHLSAAPGPSPRGPHALAIHRVSARPPHYVLVLADETVEVSRGRNNLLHTILLFIAAAARGEPPALQRLHLGPAGLNMLWIIGR
ncbi:transmembrane protein 209 [Anticarsia gemmatalis]|uniref:transmembrane protein 209 n=1 Tax=Anticarsia gemmatalis TaxID=129554 RepID=UPI003F762C88